jgi:hypothetical protein
MKPAAASPAILTTAAARAGLAFRRRMVSFRRGNGTMIETLVRANVWAERHKRLVAAVTVAAFALGCAHYARFIRLPEIVALPVVATGLLTGLRYALWDGWLKRVVEARTREGRF